MLQKVMSKMLQLHSEVISSPLLVNLSGKIEMSSPTLIIFGPSDLSDI